MSQMLLHEIINKTKIIFDKPRGSREHYVTSQIDDLSLRLMGIQTLMTENPERGHQVMQKIGAIKDPRNTDGRTCLLAAINTTTGDTLTNLTENEQTRLANDADVQAVIKKHPEYNVLQAITELMYSFHTYQVNGEENQKAGRVVDTQGYTSVIGHEFPYGPNGSWNIMDSDGNFLYEPRFRPGQAPFKI